MSRQFPALRGLAILFVLLNHSIVLGLESIEGIGTAPITGFKKVMLIALQDLGLIAVPTFLFVSGGFVAFALSEKSLEVSYRIIVKLLKHIVIPYVIWSAIFYIFIYFYNGSRFTILEYLKHLLVGYPLHFIPILIFFYLLAPLLVRFARKNSWQLLTFVSAYQFFCAALLLPGMLRLDLPEWAWFFTIPGIRLNIALWGIFFPLGLVCTLHKGQCSRRLNRNGWILVSASLCLYITRILHELGHLTLPITLLVFPLVVVLLYPLLSRDRIPLARSLEKLGRRSYGLYLSNLIWISLMLVLIHAILPGLLQHILILVPILMASTIGSVWLTMVCLEKIPIRGLRRTVFG